MTLAIGVPYVSCAAARVYTGYTRSVEGATGSGTRIQYYGNWLKDKLFSYSSPTSFPLPSTMVSLRHSSSRLSSS